MKQKTTILFAVLIILIFALSGMSLVLITHPITVKIQNQAAENKNVTEMTNEFPINRILQLPKTETLLLTQKNNHEYFAVTKNNIKEGDYEEETNYSIWMLSPDYDPLLIYRKKSTAVYFSSASSQSDQSGNMSIETISEGDGVFGWKEAINVYIPEYVYPNKLNNTLASTIWVDNFSDTLLVETNNADYRVKILAKNNCEKEYTDQALGILVNEQKFLFSKPHKITCPMIGEGEPAPTLPGVGKPFFHGEKTVSFAMPWGTVVDMDLAQLTLHSDDFSKDIVFASSTLTE